MRKPQNTPLLSGGRMLAAPSWVKPGTLAENSRFLSERVNEVGLLFFESRASLNYAEADLPESLADLPLGWHVHLPSDLDWKEPEKAACVCLALMDKLRLLDVRKAVLHPPPSENENLPAGRQAMKSWLHSLEIFMSLWSDSRRDTRDIMLENQPEHDSDRILDAAASLSCSICFDLAHFLLHNEAQGLTTATQSACLERLAPRTRLLHLCAPEPPAMNGKPGGKRGGHAPLTALVGEQLELARQICRQVDPETVFMLELFSWDDISTSLPVLKGWLDE